MSHPYPPLSLSDLKPYGRITKLHGHRGSLVIELVDDALLDSDPDFLFLLFDGLPVPFRIEEMSGTAHKLVTTFSHIRDEKAAAQIVGKELLIHRQTLTRSGADSDDDLIIATDLVGWELYHTAGTFVGVIDRIDDSTPNTLLYLSHPTTKATALIPFVEQWLSSYDEQERRLTLDFPLDLLSLNSTS